MKEQPTPATRRAPEPNGLPTSHELTAVEATGSAPMGPVPEVTVTPELPSMPSTLPAPQAPAEAARSLWTAAAGSGVAIGRKSKDAGVATAGVFSRLARRVAGSF